MELLRARQTLAGAQLGFGILGFGILPLRVPQAVMHRSDQRLRGHRLRKHAREVVEIEVGGIAAGDDDDRNVAGGVVSSHLPADVFAAQPRQAQVENHSTHRLFFESFQGIDTIFGRDDRIPLERQHAAVERAKCGIVFDDQNRRLASCGGHDRSVDEDLASLKLDGGGLYSAALFEMRNQTARRGH